jgi:DNA-binding beta-propeller fold protein YncE
VNSTGKVYVAEYGNHRVQYFSLKGSYRGQWGSEGPGEVEFVNPMGIAVAPDGNVFVADSGNHRIQCFTSTGSFITAWGTEGSEKGEFRSPRDVALTISGDRFYVGDTGNKRIQYYKYTEPAVLPTSLGRIKVLFE